MTRYLSLAIALTFCTLALGSWQLPRRARGGRAGRQFGHGFQASQGYTWQAKVDNFGKNATTYSQRYFVNDQWDDGTGPVFLSIGGEYTIDGTPTGYVAVLAEKYKALLIALEHRFYGQSIPNNDMSTPNLVYLTVEQALADTAAFIDYYNDNKGTAGRPWFTFGGSYPGALSAWFMVLYPHHSAGSLSSSGVVNAILEFPEFDEQVTAAIGNKCADQIRRIEAAFEKANEDAKGYEVSLQMFNCKANMLKNDFYFMIADSWSMADQYSSKQELCDAILSVGPRATDYMLMKTFADFTMDYWGEDFCGCFYDTWCLRNPDEWDIDSRSWRWQTCYQLSYFQTAPSMGSLRAASLDMQYMIEQCRAIFGDRMVPSTAEVNKLLGGATPYAHRVFYSDFSDDPWQQASVKYNLGYDQPYFLVMCDGCGHCKDLHTPREDDPENLKKCRSEFEEYLTLWLSMPY